MVLRHKVLSLLVTTCILFSKNTLSSAPPAPFNAEQEARIGQIAGDYLLAHPEILVQVSQKLQQQQNARKQLHYGMKVMEHQSELLNDPDTPSSGPDDAAVAVIEFFDYQCIFCSQLAPVMEQIMGTSEDVRFIFKEWPIFAQKWPASENAALQGISIWKQHGSKAYMAYHNGLYRTGHNEGKLTTADINAVTASTGLKVSPAGDGDHHDVLARTDALAQELDLTGTPGIIVMPVKNATPDRITVFPGMATDEQLQAAIVKAKL